MHIEPKGQVLGATVSGLDLSRPLAVAERDAIDAALARHGVLEFVDQTLTPREQRDFSARFGTLEVNVAGLFRDPELPEVMTLSNIVVDGRPLGIGDAGQDWHTDMSYCDEVAYANVLHGIRIPHRDGRPLGGTEFCCMRSAYDGLPSELRERLDGMTVTHDFDTFWEKMRLRPGSRRAPLTVEQRAARPPVVHPIFPVHPLSGRRVLYANPGYSVRINELPEDESATVLEALFRHQTRDAYRYVHRWREQSVLMWDNIATIHHAVADYRADEPRLIRRCQVSASRFALH